MKKPRILLDVDGVLTPSFTDQCCALLRERGYDAWPDKVDRWDIMASFKVPDPVALDVYEQLKQPGVAMTFVPHEGSQEFVRELNEWAEVYMVTTPMGGRHWTHDREDWLYATYQTPKRRVVQIHDKHIIFGHAIVDDKLAHLENFAEAWPKSMSILWRIPPNRNDQWHLEASTYPALRKLLAVLR